MSQKSILLRSFHLCTLYNPSVYRAQDPTSPIVQGAYVYSHIRYGVFVALDIFGGVTWVFSLKSFYIPNVLSWLDSVGALFALDSYPLNFSV